MRVRWRRPTAEYGARGAAVRHGERADCGAAKLMLGRMLAGLLPLRARSAASCYRRATVARERGDWTRAIGCYWRALVAEPDHAEAHNDLGIALCAVKDYAGARAAFAQALALRGGMRERLGRSPLLDAPRFVEALERLYRVAWQRAVGAKEAWC